MATIYQNFISGTLTADPGVGGVSIAGSALADLVAVTGPDTMWVVLDPLGVNGDPEIVQVTGHTAAATTAVVVRAQQGTVARAHPIGTTFTVAATKADLDELPFRVMTTRGDMLYASAANDAARLAVGGANTVLTSNGTDPVWGPVTSAMITDLTIGTGDIADLAVATGKVADQAITSAKIADLTIATGDIADSAVTTAKIADANVTTAKINNLAVQSAQIDTGAVTEFKIADSAVTSAKIANNTIVNDDVNSAAAIAYSKLALAGSIVETDLSDTAGQLGGAWTAYTPSTVNISGGTVSGRYMQFGKTIIGRIIITAGTATGAAPVELGLPGGQTVANTMPQQANLTGGVLTAARAIATASTISVYKTTGAGNWVAADSLVNLTVSFMVEVS